VSVQASDPCPCGSAEPFGGCCRPLHLGERQAHTAEELMRSRYSAFAVGDADYLWRTWHPRTRPDSVTVDQGIEWTGLEIVDSGDNEVEFRAHYREGHRRALARGGTTQPEARGREEGHRRALARGGTTQPEARGREEGQRTGTLHERSRFAVRARRWFYLDGDVFE
jgi:SEC-C motif-containing protein